MEMDLSGIEQDETLELVQANPYTIRVMRGTYQVGELFKNTATGAIVMTLSDSRWRVSLYGQRTSLRELMRKLQEAERMLG